MSKRYWDGKFALGIVFGLGIGIIWILWLDNFSPPINPPTSGHAECSGAAYDCANDSEQLPDRWYWIRRIFSLEDSVAQWLMMAFTVAAAFLLLGTLKATQDMAQQAEKTGRNQLRPWVLSDGLEINGVDRRSGFAISALLKWKNFGNSPAVETRMVAVAKVVPKGARYDPFIYDGLSHGVAIPQSAFRQSPLIPLFPDCVDRFNNGEIDWIIFGRVEYTHALDTTGKSFEEVIYRVRREANIGVEKDRSQEPKYTKMVEYSHSGEA